MPSEYFWKQIDCVLRLVMGGGVNFGVAGTGSFTSRVVIPGLNASGLSRVVALYGRTQERVSEIAGEYQISNECQTYEEMLEIADLDAVAICTPNFLHEPMAQAALRAGKAVMSEKPLGLNSTETFALVKSSRELGIATAVNFTYRSMPPFVLAGEVIRAGEIGELVSGSFNYCQSNWADQSLSLDWRMMEEQSGRGALADLGAHLIDLLLWYGDDVTDVTGGDSVASGPRSTDCGGRRTPTASDNAAFVCDVGGGRLFAFHITKSAWGYSNQINVTLVGTKGSLHLFHERGREVEVAIANPGEYEFTKIEIPRNRQVAFSDFPAHHMRQVVRGLAGDSDFPTFEDGHKAHCVIDAVGRSMAERRWIPVETGL